jgi:hypothetical protein
VPYDRLAIGAVTFCAEIELLSCEITESVRTSAERGDMFDFTEMIHIGKAKMCYSHDWRRASLKAQIPIVSGPVAMKQSYIEVPDSGLGRNVH